MYFSHCHQILYKSIFDLYQITCYMRARRLRHEWRLCPCADEQINKMLSKEDRILIKVLRVEKVYGVNNNKWISEEKVVNCFR